jgi:anti-anti-sigma factor
MPLRRTLQVNVVWTVGVPDRLPLDREQEGAMSANGPAGFFVLLQPSGVLLLRGELDLATVQDLQDAIDEILVPGEPIILDLAQLTFLETSAIRCLIRNGAKSGHPVVLRNASASVRRILDRADGQSHAWTFDLDESGSVPTN